MKEFLLGCLKNDIRWNRKKFWLYPLGFTLITLLPIAVLIGVFEYMGITVLVEIMVVIFFLTYAAVIYVSIVSYIKRLRDLDKNPWMALLTFVPLANIYLWIICAFFKGTEGQNQYGSNPLNLNALDNKVDKKETIEL